MTYMQLSDNKLVVIYILLLIVTPLIVIWPGINGPLMLDDFWNLSPLLQDRPDYKAAIFENNAGTFGRIVTMASFAFNHWLHDELIVYDLKITNLFIHIVNGLLLYFLLRIIFSEKFSPEKSQIYAFLVSFFWLVNPVNTGSVLYVIQRSALLVTTFMLLGLVVYVLANTYTNQKSDKKYIYYGICLICWVIALFCKENAVLFPLIVLIVDFCFYDRKNYYKDFLVNKSKFISIIVLLTTVFVISMVGLYASGFLNYEHRNFNITERLYTQPVALVSYLQELVLPYKIDVGLYRDDFEIRTTFWNTATAISTGYLLLLFIASIVALRKQDIRYLGAGMLIYFSGHLLESTIFPLELYFLHRNYFPSIGLFTVLVLSGAYIFQKYSLQRSAYFLVILFSLILMQHSFRQSNVYASNDSILINAFVNHPDSLRINLEMTGRLVAQGDLENSLLINAQFINKHQSISLPAKIQRLYIYCELAENFPIGEYAIFQHDINLYNSLLLSTAFYNLSESIENNRCDFIDMGKVFSELGRWIDSQLQLGSYTPERLWAIDYFIIEYFNSKNQTEIANARLQKHLVLGNENALYYSETLVQK